MGFENVRWGINLTEDDLDYRHLLRPDRASTRLIMRETSEFWAVKPDSVLVLNSLYFPRYSDNPEQTENDHLRFRIAELEQVVRELRQKGPSRAALAAAAAATQATHAHDTPADDSAMTGDGGKKRKMIVDRFARFKLDEAEDGGRHDGHSKVPGLTPDTSPTAQIRQIATVQPATSTTSSRCTSFSEGISARHRLDEGVSARRSTEREEPYRPQFTMPGQEIIGDAEGRTAYV